MQLDPSLTFEGAPVLVPAIAPDGSAPLDAEWLQRSFNALGATPQLDVDGIIGAGTRSTIKAFQASKGITVTGRVGPETIAAIQDTLKAKSATS